MDCVGIVVPRFGDEVVGGSEALARHLANLLAQSFEVHIITTTIKDFGSDERYYRSGESILENGVKVIRFEPDHKQWHYSGQQDPWTYYEIPNPLAGSKVMIPEVLAELRKTPVQVCERFISDHGPYSTRMQEFLIENRKKYKKVIFTPYLHATTYYGVDCLAKKQVVIFMAAHDEPFIYLPALEKYSHFEQWVYTKNENTIIRKSCGISKVKQSLVIPPVIFERKYDETNYDKHLLTFSGRASYGKNFDQLVALIAKSRESNLPLRLQVLGEADAQALQLIRENRDWIELKNNLSSEERLVEMSKSLCLVNPSTLDSFGLVNIECYVAGIPALVNLDCPAFEELSKVLYFAGYHPNDNSFHDMIVRLQHSHLRDDRVSETRLSLSENFTAEKHLKKYSDLLK